MVDSRFPVGRAIVVTATRDIVEGEEICLSYGPQAGRMPAVRRQAVLRQQYCFDCGCSACQAPVGGGEDGWDREVPLIKLSPHPFPPPSLLGR